MTKFKDSEEQIAIFDTAINTDSNILVDAKAGTGKCLGKGTKILMYNGSIKNVEDIIVGDLLMGDDSKPRNVLSTNIGNGELFRVKPTKDKSFVCNDVHILTLKHRIKQQMFVTFDISLNSLINNAKNNNKESNGTYVNFFLYKVAVDFDNNHSTPPYINYGYNFFGQEYSRDIIITHAENRRQIFQGIVNRYGIIQYNDIKIKNSDINHNIDLFQELIDSLGYSITKQGKGTNAYLIKGDFSNLHLLDDDKKSKLVLHQKRDASKSKFSVECVGVGDYYGFTLDGNGRFLLDSYIVTHNTTTIKGIVTRIIDEKPDKKISVVGFNNHISKELKEKLPKDDKIYVSTTHGIGFGAIKRKYKDATVNDDKVYKIIEKKSRTWGLDATTFNTSQYKLNIDKIVGLCKLMVAQTPAQILFIATKYGYKLTDVDVRRVRQVLEESLKDTKTFDFNDMVYVPAIDKKLFIFQSDYVIVDECLPKEQKIQTLKGGMTIGKIYENFKKKYRKEQQALSYNSETNEFEYKKITKVWKSETKREVFKVKLHNGTVNTTDNHKYYVINKETLEKEWIELKDLNVGDLIVSKSDRVNRFFVPNEDEKVFLQAFLMSRVTYRKIDDFISFESKFSKNTTQTHEDKVLMFNATLKDKRDTCYRYVTGNYYYNNYITNKMEYLKNVINHKHLAIIYMESHFRSNPMDSFTIKAENFDYFLVYKKIIENKFGFKEMKFKKVHTKKYMLFIDETQKEYFWKQIEPYMLPEYRVNNNISYYPWKLDTNIQVSMIRKITKLEGLRDVYDVTVEDNHNFIAQIDGLQTKGVVLHNCQDYNKAQQLILNRMIKKEGGKLISFGDRNQAIYGFMGADSESFNWFSERENTLILPLTTTYRCATRIVELARTLVPDIRAREGAPMGEIRFGSVIGEAKSGDFVLARKNAPFIKLIFDLLDEGKIASILGKEIGEDLKNKILKFGNISQVARMINDTINNVLIGLVELGITEPTVHPKYIAVKDNMDILRNLSLRSKNIGEMVNHIDNIFTDKPKGIVLTTIHKSKGLEADTVFIIKPNELKVKSPLAWMWQGELNLEYIAYTRAMNTLIIDNLWDVENDGNRNNR